MDDKRGLYAVVLVAIILLLLLARWKGPVTYVNNKGDTFNFGGPETYTVPPINLPGSSGIWDWMQTTDLACGCDAGLWKSPDLIAPVINVPVNRVYVNVIQQPVYDMPALTLDVLPSISAPVFPVYTPPPLPTWWQTYLRDNSGTIRTIRVSSDGNYFRIDKKQSYAQSTHRPDEYTLSADSLYYGTKRYIHDASKDLPALPSPKTTSNYQLNQIAKNNGWTDNRSDDPPGLSGYASGGG